MKRISPFILFSLAAASLLRAEVKLPSIFGDHMVLQQEAKVPVWGMADPGENVTVKVGDHTASTTAGADGKWRVNLEPFANGAAATSMMVTGKNTVTFSDVLIGDVWVASGQSNMWYSGGGAATLAAYPAQQAASPWDGTKGNIRLFLVSQKTAIEPVFDVMSPPRWLAWDGKNHQDGEGDHAGRWVLAEAHNARDFSAIGYFFASMMSDHLKRPIGMIGSYWPGSDAQAWTSLSGLKKQPPFTTYIQAHEKDAQAYPVLEPAYETAHAKYLTDLKAFEQEQIDNGNKYAQDQQAWQAAVKAAKAAGQPAPPQPQMPGMKLAQPNEPALPTGDFNQPCGLFNAMIAPLIPYAIKGVLWYQGESNSGIFAPEYNILFPRLISDWREKWGQGDFPFLYVQLSHNGYEGDTSMCLVREAQVRTLSLPRTGMAITCDIPMDEGIHPMDKLDPAKRLTFIARHEVYREDVPYLGPMYHASTAEGGAMRVSFVGTGSGLIIGKTPYQPPTFGNTPIKPYPTDKLIGFTIAGDDHKFVPADAKIDGDTVVVSSPQVPKPAAVRFGWLDCPQINLYNKQNLPASPFRTDTWTDFKLTPPGNPCAPPTFGMEVLKTLPPATR